MPYIKLLKPWLHYKFGEVLEASQTIAPRMIALVRGVLDQL